MKRLALILALALGGEARAQASDDELVFCEAVFRLRIERLLHWGGDSTATRLWLDRVTQEWGARNPETTRTGCGGGQGLELRGYCTSTSTAPGDHWPDVFRRRDDLRAIYEGQMRLGIFPETCMEDDACAVCLEMMRHL